MSNKIVTGSQQDIANKTGQSLAQSFMSAKVIILFDNSGSMMTRDTPSGKTRLDVAKEHLATIQGKFPAQVALVCFADKVAYAPAGYPVKVGGSTALADGLEFVKMADDCGIKIVVVSDGEPNSKRNALRIARQFVQKIDVIYVGDENDSAGGRVFLEKLANATGGQFFDSDAPGELLESMEMLLLGD